MSIEPADVPNEFNIHSPIEFEEFLRWLLHQLAIGSLKQSATEGSPYSGVDCLQLSADGPWPDIVEAEFVDAGGKRYHLFVDTYHGVGGHWRVVV